MIAVYFKFRRFWSVRNLDLVGLILLRRAAAGLARSGNEGLGGQAPADVKTTVRKPEASRQRVSAGSPRPANPQNAKDGKEKAEDINLGRPLEQRGYLWLFVVGGFFLLRMLVDSAMVRRPLLEPNLSASGLTFACAAMFVFLMSNVITHQPTEAGRHAARPASGERPHAAKTTGRHTPRVSSSSGARAIPCFTSSPANRTTRQAGHGHHRPPCRRAGDGPDRLSAFRQHAHGHCRGDPVFVVALHGQLSRRASITSCRRHCWFGRSSPTAGPWLPAFSWDWRRD